MTPPEAARLGLAVNQDGAPGVRRSSCSATPRPGSTRSSRAFPALAAADRDILAQLERDARYAPYLERQAQDVARLRRDEAVAIPAGIDYAGIAGLSRELRDKLGAVRPETVAQAARIEGMTPAALTLVLLRARQREARAAS